MDVLVILLIAILIIVGLLWLRSRPHSQPSAPATPPKPRTIRDLEPGDALSYWDGSDDAVVATVIATETINGRTTKWRWAFLGDERLLEASPEGLTIFGDPEVIHQGTADFEKFLPPHGVLATFEERVREGIIGRNPVMVEHRGRRYIVRSTGTFSAQIKGEIAQREVWRDVSEDPSQNVYFEMEAAPDQEEAGDKEVLGIWTTHLALYYGVPFDESSVKGLYTR